MNALTELQTANSVSAGTEMGYRAFQLGSFQLRRDEYFVHIAWTTRDGRPMSHAMDVGNFLRALMRDPKYWRERDPAVVARVTEGFRRLYPGS